MARPTMPAPRGAKAISVSGNSSNLTQAALAQAAQVFSQSAPSNIPGADTRSIAQPWQLEAYYRVRTIGEARYAAMLFANTVSRGEIGVSEPQTLRGKAVWITEGPEVDALAEVVPDVRARTKLIRDYAMHRVIAGECYLISRPVQPTDPGHAADPTGVVWEIVAVTELRRTAGQSWSVRFDNKTYIDLDTTKHAIIRLWSPDPEDRREAWSPFMAMLPTLREIDYLTRHIFAQVRSRLMSAGVWFLPNNLTFATPPANQINGGEEALEALSEPERLLLSLAASATGFLKDEEVAFPTVIMADPDALAQIDQKKLIQFWSEIDDKAMLLRSAAVQRFALGMDMPPEQILGASGLAVTGSGGSAGSVNHWGVWANEEQTITGHAEPALDDLVSALTAAVLLTAVPGTTKVIGYDTSNMRLRQDRSKEAIELYDRGELKGSVALRENGFDPEVDAMDDKEFTRWLLKRVAGGSASPEMVHAALADLGAVLKMLPGALGSEAAPGQPGRNEPRSLDDHPYEGPPRVQHDQTDAPYRANGGVTGRE